MKIGEELRTLKDLIYWSGSSTLSNAPNIVEKELTKEAIKHIKLLRIKSNCSEDKIERRVIAGKIQWIKYFFNITEEDIK